jgi:hypothetical protein
MQIPVPGLAFTFPGQTSVMGHQTTELGDVITLMTIPVLRRQPGQQLSPVKADLTGR